MIFMRPQQSEVFQYDSQVSPCAHSVLFDFQNFKFLFPNDKEPFRKPPRIRHLNIVKSRSTLKILEDLLEQETEAVGRRSVTRRTREREENSKRMQRERIDCSRYSQIV